MVFNYSTNNFMVKFIGHRADIEQKNKSTVTVDCRHNYLKKSYCGYSMTAALCLGVNVMIGSRINCSYCAKNSDLELQSEILEECSSKDEGTIPTSRSKSGGSCYRSLCNFRNIMAPLTFLGSLRCADGGMTSLSWKELTANLCGLIYVKDHFDAAISMGKDVPKINITSILHRTLENAGIATTNGDNGTFPLRDETVEKDAMQLFSVSDQIDSVFKGLAFNRTGTVLNHSTENFVTHLMEESERMMYNLGSPMEMPHLEDLVEYPLSNYAVGSNLSRDALKHIIYSRRETNTLHHGEYCPDLTKYVPDDKFVATVNNVFTTTVQKSDIDQETNTVLNTAVVALTVVGILSILFYALTSLSKRGTSIFGRKNRVCNTLKKVSRAICMNLSDGGRRCLQSKIKADNYETV
ncbi:hypothetical protein [Candidatus Ichthyocystis hellenicum]|uniref:hypothetical protein n=1 Tax=Candidatus Ichthyocystis hellenicum TaxID=1561003 RepID=UPI000B84FC6A|nr:hypothetical protein [Candidatus Ichthyocystis hellenicum]